MAGLCHLDQRRFDEVADGVVAVSGDPTHKVSYGGLIGGRYFDLPMRWNGKFGNDLVAEGQAKPKEPSAYKMLADKVIE